MGDMRAIICRLWPDLAEDPALWPLREKVKKKIAKKADVLAATAPIDAGLSSKMKKTKKKIKAVSNGNAEEAVAEERIVKKKKLRKKHATETSRASAERAEAPAPKDAKKKKL